MNAALAAIRRGVTAVVAALALSAQAAPAVPERVSFASLDVDPATGAPVLLTGLYYRADAESAPHGAVVALHGCGGIYSSVTARATLPTRRHQAMAELLVGEGYAVLFPDSFGPRGERAICKEPYAGRRITQRERRLDALGALAWLQARPDVAAARVALLGWSHGGGTVLASDNARAPAVVAFRGARTAPYFATAIAFYPGCGAYAHPEAYDPAAPLSIFIGADDDWTPAAPCVALGAAAAARGVPLTVTVYPASYHDFDDPAGTRQVLADIPNGHRAGGGVTVAPSADARANAYAAVRSVLRTAIGPPPVPDRREPRVHYFTP